MRIMAMAISALFGDAWSDRFNPPSLRKGGFWGQMIPKSQRRTTVAAAKRAKKRRNNIRKYG